MQEQADPSPAEPASPAKPGRLTEPVDTEQPPRLPFPVVGIGASAGGLEAISEFLATVPADSGMAFVFVQHLPPSGQSMLVEILQKRAQLPVLHVDDALPVERNHFYVIRPGHVLTIKDGQFHLGAPLEGPTHGRPIDDFFRSLAEEQRERAIAVIMSGMGSNGSAGAQAVKAVGGLCIAQDPETTSYPSMPHHLIEAGYADYVLNLRDMFDVIVGYADHPYVSGRHEDPAAFAKRDQDFLNEILAILRARAHQDFNGYKKSTVLRRIQRRMGLNRLTKLSEYATMLRQTPAEVTNLADDLLIHVTGFFRDSHAWEALRSSVVVPLIASRHNDDSVRCWVTACSSGEEAYSLAMILVEESERAGKHLDIKVFATDMAERSVANARNGVYLGGIESEISPQRLERFFIKEDALYRVRPELRERVVFAPQNLMHDPPFSRLDIISCRNLLIYLEPATQSRILALLHFGLRDGGALFLGTSETVNVDNLFEPIDKPARIYRRVGPARRGANEFYVSSDLLPREAGAPDLKDASHLSMVQMVNHALLTHHAPAAVAIDRDGKILYYHGHTEPFIGSPKGEPTRDILELARPAMRAALRTAIHRAASSGEPATVMDGIIDLEPHRRVRIAVTASPLDPKAAPGHLIVSFQERGEVHDAPPKSDAAEPDELRRVREELQSTIEEMQTSTEELKAAHEEVVSTNEELQSTNEELVTSREEMQSLNEELTTVNAQLRAKMEEVEQISSDLSSLLSSTDIAVIFLDTHLRIRRFTPAVKDLVDLIASDIGRPLHDMARKFIDASLVDDVSAVLERLAPQEREIAAESGRTYLRRALPYRTTNNHIGGVVLTFVDITDRKRAEMILRDNEQRQRTAAHAAESANEAKDVFMANMSHELRKPLAAMILWAKLLRSAHPVEPGQLSEGLDAITRSAQAQEELIGDLLDTSRISAGKLRLEPREVDLSALIHSVLEAAQSAARVKAVALNSQITPDIGVVRADPRRLERVVRNVLSNALKFTPAGGKIDLAASRLGDNVRISVTDTGCGISAEFLPHVFDLFGQANPSAMRGKAGLGLGLTIAKQLVELHGGTISVQSPGPARGAAFTVTLPLPAIASPAKPGAAQPAAHSLQGRHILLVEDDAEIRKAAHAVLHESGAEVTAVESVSSALQAYQRRWPDVIVSDLGFPDGNGRDLLQKIRQTDTDGQPPVPALALSACASEDDPREAGESGFQHFLAKPVEPAKLVSTLASLLQKPS